MADLIDRSELRERIYSRFGRCSTKVIATVEEGRVMSDWAFLEPFLNAAPAVEAEPVRRGRWIKSDVNIFKKCSECGAIWDAALCENIFFIYCPQCGSKNGGAENG